MKIEPPRLQDAKRVFLSQLSSPCESLRLCAFVSNLLLIAIFRRKDHLRSIAPPKKTIKNAVQYLEQKFFAARCAQSSRISLVKQENNE